MNLLKERLSRGEAVLGTMLSEVDTPNVVRMLAAGGFEYLIIDCEHGYFDYSQTAALIGIAAGIRLPVIVRIPEIRREVITKYMDMGANGLLVPMTNTRQEIEAVVRYAKYAPMGRRGISTQRPHTEYNPPALARYMDKANRETILLAQIETREAVRSIDEILAVDGVDAAVIGPNDLAADCGVPGDFYAPEMQNNISAVISAAQRAGKPSGIIAGNLDFLADCRKKGMTVFSCNSEVGFILSAARQTVGRFYEK